MCIEVAVRKPGGTFGYACNRAELKALINHPPVFIDEHPCVNDSDCLCGLVANETAKRAGYPMMFDRSRKDLLAFQRWVITGLYRIVKWNEYERSTRTPESTAAFEKALAAQGIITEAVECWRRNKTANKCRHLRLE